jgi:outer membrane lipoprotein carrier protein
LLCAAALGASAPRALAADSEPAAAAAPAEDESAAGVSDAPSANELGTDEIAQRVQAFYDGAKTFQANFVQRYTIFAYNKQKQSKGRVAFVKPGKMSWRYTNNSNRVVSDGRLLKVYEAENKQLYQQNVAKSPYPAALAFLLGEGKLKESFVLKKLNAQTLKFKGGYVLLATPREPTPAYQKMLLYVDGQTFQVRRVLLIDAQKNKNLFDFADPIVNVPIAASEFSFNPPSGTQIITP